MAFPYNEVHGLFLVLLAINFAMASKKDIPVFPLGALIPTQDNSAIPPSLAYEWHTAFRVALDVLNNPAMFPQYGGFQVEGWVGHTDCSWDSAMNSTVWLQGHNVVGVVGAACSDASIAAAKLLQMPPGTSMISYASTALALRDKTLYPNFFSTAFSDEYQALAIVAAVETLKITKVGILYTPNDAWSEGLTEQTRQSLQLLTTAYVVFKLSVSRDPTDIEVEAIFANDNVQPDVAVVMAVAPKTAQRIWEGAVLLNKTGYPWWFFGTDGATSFDFAGTGSVDPLVVAGLQGQIGIAPSGAERDSTEAQNINTFLDYWRQQTYFEYPGIVNLEVTPPVERPRPYVAQLFDAVWIYFEAIHFLVSSKQTVTTASVLARLKDMGGGFRGCTGWLQFNPATGDRAPVESSPVSFDFVNLQGTMWEPLASWYNKRPFELNVSTVTRPGPLPAGSVERPSNRTYFVPPAFEENETAADWSDRKILPKTPEAREVVKRRELVGIMMTFLTVMAIAVLAAYLYINRETFSQKWRQPFTWSRQPTFVRIVA